MAKPRGLVNLPSDVSSLWENVKRSNFCNTLHQYTHYNKL